MFLMPLLLFSALFSTFLSLIACSSLPGNPQGSRCSATDWVHRPSVCGLRQQATDLRWCQDHSNTRRAAGRSTIPLTTWAGSLLHTGNRCEGLPLDRNPAAGELIGRLKLRRELVGFLTYPVSRESLAVWCTLERPRTKETRPSNVAIVPARLTPWDTPTPGSANPTFRRRF
jgi:hypothetical protein